MTFMLTCIILLFACLKMEAINEAVEDKFCEKNSSHFLQQDFARLECERLNYSKQLCYISNSTEWNCLKERARNHDFNSCNCIDSYRARLSKNEEVNFFCAYVEVCAFEDDDFNCTLPYNCSFGKDQVLNCVGENGETFIRNCTPSLLYCPTNLDYDHEIKQCRSKKLISSNFEEHCLEKYHSQYEGNGTVWYYIMIKHFDRTSDETERLFSTPTSGFKPEKHQLCSPIPESDSNIENIQVRNQSGIVGGAIVGAVVMMLIAYGSRKLWDHYKKKYEVMAQRDEQLAKELEDKVFNNTPYTSVPAEEMPKEEKWDVFEFSVEDAAEDLQEQRDEEEEISEDDAVRSSPQPINNGIIWENLSYVSNTKDVGLDILHINDDSKSYISKKLEKNNCENQTDSGCSVDLVGIGQQDNVSPYTSKDLSQ